MHKICFKGAENMGSSLINQILKNHHEEELKEWLNQKTTDDGFTALHFASFRGNIALI